MSVSEDASAKQLKELLAKRSSIKGRLTRFKKYLDCISSLSLTKLQIKELDINIEKIRVMRDKFDNLQEQIEVLNCESMESEIDERDDIEKIFSFHLASANELLDKSTELLNNSNLHESSQSHQDHSFHCNHTEFKLPQIQITKFDGAYFRWLEFRDTFLSLIHNNERIKHIHKFHYLESYLEGEAAQIISNLGKSESNYETAWKLLCERYDNKRALIDHHLDSLCNISVIRESNNSLRSLVDHVTKNLRALSSLGEPVEHWDTLVIHLISSKLDRRTTVKWEEYRNELQDVYPSLKQFNKFLTDRANVLDKIFPNKYDKTKTVPTQSHSTNRNSTHVIKTLSSTSQTNKVSCVICKQDHRIYDCPIFISRSIPERRAEASKLRLCLNCLRLGHSVNDCKLGPCRECKRKHNTLLHLSNVKGSDAATSTTISVNNSIAPELGSTQVLLSTALVRLINPCTNKYMKVRALLDCGSQASFISQSLMDKLSLEPCQMKYINIRGISNYLVEKINQSCIVQLQSINSKYTVTKSFYVLKQITNVPNVFMNTLLHKIPKNIKLADPKFYESSSIDILIGADLFWDLLSCGQRSLGPNLPKLQYSKLGWLIAGSVITKFIDPSPKTFNCNTTTISDEIDTIQDIHRQLKMFWELEQVPERPLLTDMEISCENHYITNTYRLPSGRFCVRLPLIETPDCLGDSYLLARKRFLTLEKRFRRNAELKTAYTNFIQEYAELGHLQKCSTNKPYPSYYLCHHAVFKPSSDTTKTRVVFDGSARTSSGFSLNDILMIGQQMQDSLFSILIRARQYKYILTGDIEKMYRQVEVDERDRNLLLILWREDESKPIQTLQLNTVTYGLASSAYLSTRCLWQLGDECNDDHIGTIIKHDFYVDDVITGSDNESHLLYIQNMLSTTLQSGGFKLCKFKSNSPFISKSSAINQDNSLRFSDYTSTLGLGWNPAKDTLNISIETPQRNLAITKRNILSTSFKIFDPLGLLSPCIIKPKLLLQSLWLTKTDWDEPVNEKIQKSWTNFISNLHYLSNIQIPRLVLCDSPISREIHTFSDASQLAYGACIYMRSTNESGDVTVKLLCAKSKVAPIKATTIPRLELCAALLAAELYRSVIDSLRYKVNLSLHWCDSSVVLSWLQGNKKLKTFVANRVSKITELTRCSSWRYVPTDQNPADLISRGVNPDQLGTMNLWWSGPHFLRQHESFWPGLHKSLDDSEIPELKSNSILASDNCMDRSIEQLIRGYSSFTKLRRIFAYIKRFINNARSPKHKIIGILTATELESSFITLCKISQQESFAQEYDLMLRNKRLSPKCNILSLTPFLDNNKVIRVGGRIDASDYDYNKKHPILLHSSHHLTKIYFRYQHLHNMHAGPQLLLACVRDVVWPVNGRHLARRTVHGCVICRRVQGKTMSPMMGNLPKQRITADFPFRTVGVDFAGPFYTINKRGRGARVSKTYLCVFVCFRYKCVHLEAVSDLSKESYILTLHRFISRRGKPAEIFSDNGRNFVAAAREIGDFLKTNQTSIADYAHNEGIKFIFSPSYAPHFGGIWEAGVKSAKYHIKRVMGNTHLTFDEISTLFAQVEAILNSRPLCPLSSSPNDYLFLTPGHFLIGRPLNSLPTPSIEDQNATNLDRYKRLEQIRQHFWQRWQKEYIGELQQRSKWRSNSTKLSVGDLVLLQEDNVPPLCWRMGRVSRLFPGTDGISRVANIQTTRGCFRRPLTRLCPLPTTDEDC